MSSSIHIFFNPQESIYLIITLFRLLRSFRGLGNITMPCSKFRVILNILWLYSLGPPKEERTKQSETLSNVMIPVKLQVLSTSHFKDNQLYMQVAMEFRCVRPRLQLALSCKWDTAGIFRVHLIVILILSL